MASHVTSDVLYSFMGVVDVDGLTSFQCRRLLRSLRLVRVELPLVAAFIYEFDVFESEVRNRLTVLNAAAGLVPAQICFTGDEFLVGAVTS